MKTGAEGLFKAGEGVLTMQQKQGLRHIVGKSAMNKKWYCDVTYNIFTWRVNVALALPSLTLWQDGHTGGEHCSGSPIKLTACTWNF